MEALQISLSSCNAARLQSEYFRNLPSCDFLEFATLFAQIHKRGSMSHLYRNLLTHFQNYQHVIGRTFTTSQIGREELDDFIQYLHIDKGLKLSTIKSMITRFKYLLKKAYLKGWAVDDSYSEVKVRENESTFVYYRKGNCPHLLLYRIIALGKRDSGYLHRRMHDRPKIFRLFPFVFGQHQGGSYPHRPEEDEKQSGCPSDGVCEGDIREIRREDAQGPLHPIF